MSPPRVQLLSCFSRALGITDVLQPDVESRFSTGQVVLQQGCVLFILRCDPGSLLVSIFPKDPLVALIWFPTLLPGAWLLL